MGRHFSEALQKRGPERSSRTEGRRGLTSDPSHALVSLGATHRHRQTQADASFRESCLRLHSSLFVGLCGGWSQAIEAQIACHLGVVVFEVGRQFKESPCA